MPYFELAAHLAHYDLWEIDVKLDENQKETSYTIFLDDPNVSYGPSIKLVYQTTDERIFTYAVCVDPDSCKGWDQFLAPLRLYGRVSGWVTSEADSHKVDALYFRTKDSKFRFDLALFYNSVSGKFICACCRSLSGESICFNPLDLISLSVVK